MPRRKDVGEYCGRNFLYGLITLCDETPYERRQDHLRKRDKALIATLFLTGGSVEEVLMLTKGNFDFEDSEAQAGNAFVVKKMILLRRRIKKKKPKPVFRTFPIFEDDPLQEYLRDWLDTEVSHYLFAGQSKGQPLSRTQAWNIISGLRKRLKRTREEINKQIWFKNQRMLYLARELGWSDIHIQQYFKMENPLVISGNQESWRNLLYIHRKPHARESMEKLIFPNGVLKSLPPEVIKTVKGIMLNYHNNYPRFCFGGMRTALIDAIRIRFKKDRKASKLYDAEGNEYSLPKLIELAKEERYITRHSAEYLRRQVKVFGDISLHDFMADLRKEEVPSIFTQLRMALARMYYKEKSR